MSTPPKVRFRVGELPRGFVLGLSRRAQLAPFHFLPVLGIDTTAPCGVVVRVPAPPLERGTPVDVCGRCAVLHSARFP